MTISSNGTDNSTVSFVCTDRSSVVTINNVALDVSDIVFNDDIAFDGSFYYDVQEGTLALKFAADNYSKIANDLSNTDISIAAGAVLEVEGVDPEGGYGFLNRNA